MSETWASKVKQTTSRIPHSGSVISNKAQLLRDHRKDGISQIHLTPNTSAAKEPEEMVANKKRKKKKKNKQSANNNCQEAQTSPNEQIIVQELPRIQDDEEFPVLASPFAGLGSRHEPFKSHSYSQSSRQGKDTGKPKGSGKKSKAPVQLDLGGMLAVLEKKQNTEKTKQSTKPVVFSVGGGMPVVTREAATTTKHQQLKPGPGPHNPLDSSAPMVKKGKQREVPKAKKPTSLKKIILKEREQRKQLRSLTQETTASGEEGSSLPCEPKTLSPDAPPFVPETEKVKYLTNTTNVEEQPGDTTNAVASLSHENPAVPKIHSRRFREYCSQVLSKEVDKCATCLLQELVRFQDRMYQKDPVKAKTKRRLVMGLREVLKHLKLGKLKCVIISPNCERSQFKGGLDDTLQTIIDCAQEQNVPCVFALNRKALGRSVNKAVPVSVVGIFSYDGAQDHFHKLCELTFEARKLYEEVAAANLTYADTPETDPEPSQEPQPSPEKK
ncbi:selenocysteine insertion sequence-binding protein 2, partial [Pelobates fuscus]|uniref:selenocysteine insertion sequence-binding protein 2 n=1 Tax=Pelobates fuscus TaxID=191477 RepID=UPI002FE4E493